MGQFQLSLSHWAKVALAVVGAFFFAEARACASCNDHTAFSFASFGQEPVPTGARNRQAPAPSSAVPQGQPLPCSQCPANPLEAPCRGPSCSGNNLPDGLPVTTGKINVTQDQWNLSWIDTHLSFDEQIDWLALGQILCPVSRANSIFHPPRCA